MSAAQPAGEVGQAHALPADVAVALPVQEELSAPDLVELAVLAESLGYSTVFAGEIAGTDAFSLLGAVAARTSSLRIGTGITSVFVRSIALTAMGFATLDSLAAGRVIAGLGVGSRVVVEDWHGGEFIETRARLAESIMVLRRLLSGERVTHDTAGVRTQDFRLTVPDVAELPVFVGALSRTGLRLAGEVADGVLMAFSPPDEVAGRLELVREGAARSGRDLGDITIASYVNCHVGDPTGPVRERMRRLILQYAVQPTHQAAFRTSFPGLDTSMDLWLDGRRRQALELIPDEAVSRLTPVGSAEIIVDRLEELRARGVTLPVLFPQTPHMGDASAPAETMRAVAAEYRRRRARVADSPDLG